jgi:hypothetical protein
VLIARQSPVAMGVAPAKAENALPVGFSFRFNPLASLIQQGRKELFVVVRQ